MAQLREIGVCFENLRGAEWLNAAELAEKLGLRSFWIPEDLYFRGAFSLASAIAGRTNTIRICLGIVNVYTRHPVSIAMEAAAVDEISSGRFCLGLGASLPVNIRDQLHSSYARPRTRMRETIEIVRRLLAGDRLEYVGKEFQVSGVKLSFAPYRAELPIELGVVGPQNLQMAGELADGVVLSVMSGPSYVRFAVDQIRKGAERVGRQLDDFEVAAIIPVCISNHARAARDAIRPWLGMLIGAVSVYQESPLLTHAGLDKKDLQPFAECFAKGQSAGHLVTEELVDEFMIAGSPENCRARLRELVDAGVTTLVAFETPGMSSGDLIGNVHSHLAKEFL